MLPNAEMVPKSADSTNGKQLARAQFDVFHSCHHVDTILHPNSSYVTTKLYGTSTCGWNNNTIFSEWAILTFPTVRRVPGTLAWQRPSLGDSCQNGKMATLLNSLFFMFKISFLPKYRVKHYDYIVKSDGYFLHFSFNTDANDFFFPSIHYLMYRCAYLFIIFITV